jgi:acyl-CoA reductase-like NAD-dependent aldehyde dehydrogenase
MYKNYINGEWRETQNSREDINPSDVSDVVGVFAAGDAAQLCEAVEAAKVAQPAWAAASLQERFGVLDTIGTEILARKEELGRLLAREEGKVLHEGIAEVARAGQIFKFFAGEVVRLSGEHIDSVRPGVEIDILRQPIGIVGLITPWNYPIAIPAWKIAPALAFGNAIVFKPAELAPACAWNLAEVISRSTLPRGVFNMVMGRGSVVGEGMVQHPDVAGISFTGSVEIGRGVAQGCAKRLAKVQLEMGGKNPLVVLDDADLNVAVNAAINGSYYSTGQRCTASSRLVVSEGIHDKFITTMIEVMKGLKVDDALANGTDIGPVIDEAQLAKDISYVELGKKEGARLAYGGKRIDRPKKGFYFAPALLTGADNDMRVSREEIFGPVASVIKVKDYDEALVAANDTPYGLTAGICTRSLKYATHFKQHSESGMVMVNLPTAGVDFHVPFGGRKGSSYGSREQGRYAAEFYTTVKTCYTSP